MIVTAVIGALAGSAVTCLVIAWWLNRHWDEPSAAPITRAEQLDRLDTIAFTALRLTFADGRAQGRQPGEWATKFIAEHLAHVEAHARACLVTSGGSQLTHLQHLITRAAMALALLQGGHGRR